MPNQLSRAVHSLQSGWKPYGFLILLMLLAFAALAVRGFTLGFYGDVVNHHFHYRFDGVLGGAKWLTAEAWQRHLLGGWLSTALHVLAPERYDLWYALALFLHLALGPIVLLLIDTLQNGQRRWVAIAIALFFVFDPLQTPSNIEFATSTQNKVSLMFAILSLWSYVKFVRGQRQQLGWYILNIVTFMFAIMIYEQSFLFFVLHPLIGFVEDRRSDEFRLDLRYLWLTIRDSLFHVIVLAIYVYLLLVLFGIGNSSLRLTPANILTQISDGLVLQFSPLAIADRIRIAMSVSQAWVLGTVALMVALPFGIWIWITERESFRSAGTDRLTPWSPKWILVLGFVLALLNIVNASPTNWPLAWNVRLIYASTLGTGMVIVAAVAWLVDVNPRFGAIIFALCMALLLAPGISYLFEHQAIHLNQDKVSNRVFRAIFDAIPEFAVGAEPYLLLITDVDAEDTLHLHPRDTNFPHVFALHYDIESFAADAVLFDDDNVRKLAQIKLGDAGIISPLRPYDIVGYDRVVIVSYGSGDNGATILDQLPNDVLQRGNFDIDADVTIATNWSLLP